ncbi:MAG TPA: hypothetical protein VHN39_05070 [Phenylobacterium sp.]|jgi:hypothetical protein|nr:hypothetical protein [Phenylobacterium sp.]
MRFAILAAAAALALAVGAIAAPDPGAGVTYGNNNIQPQPAPYSYQVDLGSPGMRWNTAATSKEFKMACAADRETFCKGRISAGAVWECIRIRRSKLSTPCREATYKVERAFD